MLPTTLNTNEVKNAAGTEEQFIRDATGPGSKLTFRKEGEAPNQKHRLTISHSETGAGAARRRRSLVRFDKDVAGASGDTRTVSCYAVMDSPVGDLAADTELENVCANLVSLLASTGATTTILYDGTGNGATCLIQGTL